MTNRYTYPEELDTLTATVAPLAVRLAVAEVYALNVGDKVRVKSGYYARQVGHITAIEGCAFCNCTILNLDIAANQLVAHFRPDMLERV